MQKKLIALAVAGVASSAAFAQSNVTIYGDLKPSFDSIKVENANGRFNGMASNNSNIGFRGEENLGNGLKAIFQIESGVAIGGDTPQSATWGGRNTFAGFKGGFGEFTMGRRDTAYKSVSGSYDPFADSIGDYNNIIGSAFGTSALLDQRPNSSFNYISPSWGGFKVAASYALRTDNATTGQDDNISSIAVSYDLGGLNLLAAFEKQMGSAQAAANSVASQNREGWKIGAKYNFGKASVFGLYEEIEQADSVTTGRKRDAWYLGGTYAIGAVDLMATYIRADNESGTGAQANSGAKNWNLGARYNLSKRTNVSFIYSDLDNKSSTGVASTGGAYTMNLKGSINAQGLDAKGFSVRMQHKF